MFDLLHTGHVALLEAARAEGDALVVGVNSDASARRLGKGPDRPIVAEAERARMLAALGRGADYARDAIVGATEVEGWGGRVVRVPLVRDKSTTKLLERLRG